MKFVLALVLSSMVAVAQAPVTGILTTLTIKPEIDRTQMTKVMQNEVRTTLQLYLDGKIQQWWARGDGKGVVFIMNCKTATEAKAITDTLPLSKAGFANFEYTELTPLNPLRLLLSEPKQ